MTTADGDEIVAELTDVLQALVDDEHLELASSRAIVSLASRLLVVLENDPEADVGEWLVERDEVSELYIEGDELAAYFRGVLRRMTGEDATPKFHPELRLAIADAPDDLHARAVYADWLQENGDPRGELMILQLAQVKPKIKKAEKEKLAQRQNTLLAKHRTHFYGDLTLADDAFNRVSTDLVFGFLDEAVVADEHNFRTLITLESGQLLRRLSVTVPNMNPIDALLATTPLPPTVRRLTLEHQDIGYGPDKNDCLDVGRALRGLSRLESVSVSADKVIVNELASPALQDIVIEARKLEMGPRAALGALDELLRIEVKARELDPDAIATVRSLLASPKLEAVKIASLADGSVARDLARALLESPVASRLKRLQLDQLQLDDPIASLLLALPSPSSDALELSLRSNNFSSAMNQALLARWPKCGVPAFDGDEDWEDDEDGEEDDEDGYDSADE